MSADEEKTRVLPGKPAADEGESIVFRCPNGHKIIAPAAQAGKRGICSKCKTPVTIPAPGGAEAAEAGGAPLPGMPETEAAIPAIGPLDGAPAVTVEAGGMTIDVPDQPPGGGEEDWNFIGGQALEPAAGSVEPRWSAGPPGPVVERGGTVAQLVARLWAEREHGGVIELHLDGGSVIIPEWYDANWSRGTHGLFASPAADGSVTLTAVAWDTVRKIVVRQLTEVPDDMFT